MHTRGHRQGIMVMTSIYGSHRWTGVRNSAQPVFCKYFFTAFNKQLMHTSLQTSSFCTRTRWKWPQIPSSGNILQVSIVPRNRIEIAATTKLQLPYLNTHTNGCLDEKLYKCLQSPIFALLYWQSHRQTISVWWASQSSPKKKKMCKRHVS